MTKRRTGNRSIADTGTITHARAVILTGTVTGSRTHCRVVAGAVVTHSGAVVAYAGMG
jgi:predicted TIM-barrel enzyme